MLRLSFLFVFIFSLKSWSLPIPLGLMQTKPQLWDIKHNVFSKNNKVGNWRQKLRFNSKTKIFNLNTYSSYVESLGAKKVEEFLISKSDKYLKPLAYHYILKINGVLTKTISASFYKKWENKKILFKKFTKKNRKHKKNRVKKHRVAKIKSRYTLWVSATTTKYKNKKAYSKSFSRALPDGVFLNSFLSLLLSQKTKQDTGFLSISFVEQKLHLQKAFVSLLKQDKQSWTWRIEHKNYNLNATMDKTGKLIKTNMPVRQLRSQIVNL